MINYIYYILHKVECVNIFLHKKRAEALFLFALKCLTASCVFKKTKSF